MRYTAVIQLPEVLLQAMVTKIFHKWKTFKTTASLTRDGCPSKLIQKSDGATHQERAKTKQYISESTDLS